MHNKLLILLNLLIVVNVLAEWNSNDFMKREHSLIKPYQGNRKL
uniref:Secreted Lectin-like protein n=1 Tax=Pristhesancus plagipennis TaxID=1955184 RepID=A0A2K8JM53_PRIPG|nr:secreted Lectin-like protein [Pristhesancus plagipennis]